MRICDLIKDQETYQAELVTLSWKPYGPWSNATSAQFPSFTAESLWGFSRSATLCAGSSPKAAITCHLHGRGHD